MSRFFAYATSLLLPTLLIVGIFQPMKGLVTLSVTIAWILSIMGLALAFILICMTVVYATTNDESMKDKTAACLKACAKRRGILGKCLGWIEFVVVAFLLGYGGFIFTAVIYVISSLVMRFVGMMAREEAIKSGLVQSPK